MELKNFIRENDTNIVCAKTLPQNPAEIFLVTNSFLVVVEVNKFYRPSYGFNHCFSTKLTTLNVFMQIMKNKEFVVRSEGCFKTDISVGKVSKMVFEEDILFNSFYLSF